MGLFSMFGGQKDYPTLGPDNPAAEKLANIEGSLKSFVDEVPDKLEVIPAEDGAYIFIGKPPKKFGIAWIKDGQVSNFKTLAEEQGIQPLVLQGISEELRTAYESNEDAERFQAEVGGKSIVVTPSEKLKNEVATIINKVTN